MKYNIIVTQIHQKLSIIVMIYVKRMANMEAKWREPL